MTHRITTLSRTLLLVAFATLALAGCDDGDDDPGTDTSTAADATSTDDGTSTADATTTTDDVTTTDEDVTTTDEDVTTTSDAADTDDAVAVESVSIAFSAGVDGT